MVLSKIVTLSLGILFLSGCTSTSVEVSGQELRPVKPNIELSLLPVEFDMIVVDNKTYYALDHANYSNLSVNMLNIQIWIYQAALWENLNSQEPIEPESIKDKGE